MYFKINPSENGFPPWRGNITEKREKSSVLPDLNNGRINLQAVNKSPESQRSAWNKPWTFFPFQRSSALVFAGRLMNYKSHLVNTVARQKRTVNPKPFFFFPKKETTEERKNPTETRSREKLVAKVKHAAFCFPNANTLQSITHSRDVESQACRVKKT